MKKQLILGISGVILCIGVLIYIFEIRGRGLVGINCKESEKLQVFVVKKLMDEKEASSLPSGHMVHWGNLKYKVLGRLLTEQQVENVSFSPVAQFKEEFKEKNEALIKRLKSDNPNYSYENLLKDSSMITIKMSEKMVAIAQKVIKENMGNYMYYQIGSLYQDLTPIITELKSDSLVLIGKFKEETVSNFHKSFVCKDYLANKDKKK